MAGQNKPSFFRSMMMGVGGYIKGTIEAGIVGILAGAAIGAVAGALFPAAIATSIAALAASGGITATGALTAGTAAIYGAIAGGTIGGGLLSSIGALSGTFTSVIKSRETAKPAAEEIAHVANAAFVQGMVTGQQAAQEQQSTHFRDRIAQERALAAQQQVR